MSENHIESTGSHHGSGHHHHRHGHRGSLKHRVKRRLRRKKWLVPAMLVAAAVVIAFGIWAAVSVKSQSGLRVTSANQYNAGGGYREITYKGKRYSYNNRITSVLYAGVDSAGELRATKKYTIAPRADSISLVVMDEYSHKMTIIGLSRDTMTKIRRFTLNGRDRGLFTDHLGYAFTYGDGGDVSCQNLCEAVSELLYGVPVNEYVVSNRSSIRLIGEIIGDVEVVVPNNSLASEGYIAGQTATVGASNIEQFVRSRDTDADFSNTPRMQRQQAYINGAVEQIRTMLIQDPSAAWRRLEAAEDFMLTNITRSRYLDLAGVLKNTSYDARDYYIPEGEQVAGPRYDEFYPDEEALLEKVIEIFYIER